MNRKLIFVGLLLGLFIFPLFLNIHKVNAEKNPTARVGQVKINNTVAITNIEPLNMKLAGKAGCKFTFTFGSKFEPALGAIDIEGSILFTVFI